MMGKALPECVVPLEGTWIEIANRPSVASTTKVVPLEGTWIEIIVHYDKSYLI
mgnify:FL=1